VTPAPRDLLHRLFEYIEEQAKDIDPRGFQVSKHSGFKCNPEDIAELPGIHLDLQLEGDYIWLKVDRLEADKPPAIPGLCRVSSDPFGQQPSFDEAALLHRIHTESELTPSIEHAQLEARIRGSAAQILHEYTKLWKAWAEGEKPRRKTISLYGDIFALKHQLEAEETAKPTELVWGVGVATWAMDFQGSSFPFTYPMLTQAAEIALNEQTMAIEVRPRATDTRVEMDAFVACQVNGAAEVEKAAREHLAKHKDRPVTPFDPSSYSDVLKLAATNLNSKGSYQEILAAHAHVPPAGQHLVVTDTWVLFSRPRANNYLIEDLKRLRDQLANGCDIPVGPLALVSPPSDKPVEYETVNFRGISSRGNYEEGGKPQELYFPLPYNSEQVTIVQRLERAAGVTVQGPPGTGKTHTIANIICHYLATGRRVLVTSRGEPALEVLQSKIPEEVRDLTVALLTSDREGMRQFQGSIEAIQHQVSQINPEEMREQISILQQAIDRTHSELSTIDRRVDEIAIYQLSEIKVDGAPMRAQNLAELVVRGQDDYAWFDDVLSLSPVQAPPFSENEAGTLREYRRKLGTDLIYASASIPSADDLPNPADIAELHNVLSQMKKLDSQVKNGQLLPLKGLTAEVLQSARELLASIDEALALVAELEAIDGDWPMELRARCRVSSFASERQALEMLFTDVDHLVQARAEFLIKPVDFPSEGLTSPKVLEAIARAAETGKPFGLLSFGAGDTKSLLSSIRVAGLTPNGNGDWAHIQRYVALHGRVTSFLARWNQFADALSVPRLSGGVESLREIELVAVAARKAHTLARFYDEILPEKAEAVFEHVPTAELCGGSSELRGFRKQLLSHLTRSNLSGAATRLSTLQEKLAGKTGPVSEDLRTFVDQDLGNPSLEASRMASRFTELVMELRRIAGLSAEVTYIRDSAARMERAGATKLAARVRTIPIASTGEDAVFPASWRQAWNWARMKSHLDSIEARDELKALAGRRRNLEGGLSKLYKDMVSKAAWLETKRNSTPKVLQALAGYATAIRKIGMGTGPNAVRYRRDARESMLDAAGAVPCWIMSHAKISESMPPDIGLFDLVIVDEASQSNLWALPAIVRGKKILVVGDDKQVSPDAGFVSSQRIDELKHRFLGGQPYGIEMTPEKSLYELAARVFAAEQVMLREHFRCVPPIIAYSNSTFYKNGIQPLRIPKASERIDPPLVDIYVEGGLRDRHDCNAQEADVIAEEIAAILKDEQYASRTLGVVSLLGMEQAKHIDSVVRMRCPATELIHRKFECGDARTFQGSERDIMFLSMVVDPSRSKAVSGNMFEQRFNVAASRARDRMYLVRSVAGSHLSDKDLRLTLLSHFDKHLVADSEGTAHLLDLCESGFERDVYTHLTKAGYRVIPQVKSGAYRIDMVVEGTGDTRLAVECDGDEYHGPDRWQQDMNRQRVLERAGWTFWRCFASTWTLRKEDVFGELIERLSAMGVEPLGALDRAPSLVEKRTWKAVSSTEREDVDQVSDVIEDAITAVNQ
jgi:very-short-patch-repair endonuclease